MKKLVAPALAGFIMFMGADVQAALITYNFEGTVNRVANLPFFPPVTVSVGEEIPISITVDTTDFPYSTRSIPSALFKGVNKTTFLYQIITIKPNASIEFNGSTAMTAAGFDLLFTGPQNGVLATSALPATLNPADFSSGTFTVTRFNQGGPYFDGYSGTINVPEPASWAMLITGLLFVGVARRRQH